MKKSTNQQNVIWFNGKFLAWQDANVHVLTHALHYGSSFFEGIRAYETPNGPAIFRLEDHIERLFNSMKIYDLYTRFKKNELMEACRKAIRKNNLKSAYIRPLAFIGNIGLGLCPPKDLFLEVMIAAFPWESYLGKDSMENGINACISSWSRLAPNTMPALSKAGGNYLSSQLISREAKRHHYQEGIALNIHGLLSEGAGENLFIVKNNKLITSPAHASILPGITRDTVITFAHKLGYPVIEQDLPRETLYLADEIFMTGTAAEIVPVISIDQISIGSRKPGSITRSIQNAFLGLFSHKTKDEWGWLDYVEK